MPVTIENILVVKDFIIADITEIDDTQIILGRPFLATIGFHIDVKRGRLTFEVQGSYAIFCYVKDKMASPSFSLSDAFPYSPEIDMDDVMNCQDPPNFDWISAEDPHQGYVKV